MCGKSCGDARHSVGTGARRHISDSEVSMLCDGQRRLTAKEIKRGGGRSPETKTGGRGMRGRGMGGREAI